MTASSCLMGPEIRENLSSEIARIYHSLDGGLTPLSTLWPGAPTHKHKEREAAKNLHVWEKGVTRNMTSVILANDPGLEDMHQSKLNLVAAATRDRRKEKENMADFIAKKREMFLVQMSLDTKRAEIRKLEERAQHVRLDGGQYTTWATLTLFQAAE